MFFLAMATINMALAQGKIVTGQVTDDTGETLPGVNVMIKGTTTGTVTDFDGHYSLEVNQPKAALVYSFVGLKTITKTIGNQSKMDVVLGADAKQLEAVEIVGYTKVNQATSVPKIENVKEIVTPSVANGLEGKATGLSIQQSSGQPGAKANIRVRGMGSISSSADPLYVIDGVIVSADPVVSDGNGADTDPLSSINPSDIEDIRVLKDAAATVLYGARGSNGVIVITTKKGKAGKTKFNFSGSYGVTQINRGNFKLMDGPTYASTIGKMHGIPDTGINTDWVDEAFRLGKTQDYQLSANGGNESVKYYASMGYFQQDGILIGSDFDRINGRFSLDDQVNEKLSFNIGTDLSLSNTTNAGKGEAYSSPLSGAYANSPLVSGRDDHGNPLPRLDEMNTTRANFLYESANKYNKRNNLWGGVSGKLNYQINDDFSLSSTNSYRFNRSLSNSYTAPSTFDGNASHGRVDNSFGNRGTFTTTNLVNYEHTFAGKHNVSVMAGTEYQSETNTWGHLKGTSLPSGLENPSSASDQFGIGGKSYDFKFFSLLSQATYDYNGIYYASLSLRRDGSSRFGSKNRYGNFYAVGASWNIANESFFKSKLFTDLKLRASYGTTGNASIGNYNWQNLFSYDTYLGNPAAYHYQLGNENLTWEKKVKSNIGLDFSLIDRVSVNVDLYSEKSKDILLSQQLASSSGFRSIKSNIGSMVNRGIEIAINSQNLKMDKFTWNTSLNFSYNKNEVLTLNAPMITNSYRTIEGQPYNRFYLQEWMGAEPQTGKPAWYVNENAPITKETVQKSSSLFYAPNGRVATTVHGEANQIDAGSTMPIWNGGITNSFSFRQFDFSFMFNFRGGNKILNSTLDYADSDGNYLDNQVAAANTNRWEKPGDIAFRPAWGSRGGNQPSTRTLEDGDYLQLRNVTLGYRLPQATANKLKLSSVRFYVSGQNLFTWSNFSGYTPTTVDNGATFYEYPEGRLVSAGVNVKF